MSLEPLQSRMIQNTRPNDGTSNQPAQQNNQAKADLQGLHAAPGAPSEPPRDPDDPKKPSPSAAQPKIVQVQDLSSEDKALLFAMLTTGSVVDIPQPLSLLHQDPLFNIYLNCLYDQNYPLGSTDHPLTQKDLAVIFQRDPDFRFQNRIKVGVSPRPYSLNLEDGLSFHLHKMLNGADFSDTVAYEASFGNCYLDDANFSGSYLDDSNFVDALLSRANFEASRLNNANLKNATLDVADMQRASLHRARLQYADLTNANLSGSSLFRANFSKSYLENANFVNAKAILVDERRQCEVNFTEANAEEANFTNAVLGKAKFDKSNLNRAILSVASTAKGIAIPNELFLGGAFLEEAQIFLDLAAKELVPPSPSGTWASELQRTNGRPRVRMFMNGTSLQKATIVNLAMFPGFSTSTYYGVGSEESPRRVNDLRGVYLRNVNFINEEIFNNDAAPSMQGCRATPDTVWPEGFDHKAAGITIIPITDWTKTSLRHHKFDKQFMIQSTLEKTEEEVAKIKSLDLTGADCTGSDFSEFHDYISICNWNNVNLNNATGVHKSMLLMGAKGNPVRPILGCAGVDEEAELLRKANAGHFTN